MHKQHFFFFKSILPKTLFFSVFHKKVKNDEKFSFPQDKRPFCSKSRFLDLFAHIDVKKWPFFFKPVLWPIKNVKKWPFLTDARIAWENDRKMTVFGSGDPIRKNPGHRKSWPPKILVTENPGHRKSWPPKIFSDPFFGQILNGI